MATMDSDWLRHFRLLKKNHYIYWHQKFQKCSSSSPEEVLLLFFSIRNLRWPPWTLIGRDIFDFFSRTIALSVTKLAIQHMILDAHPISHAIIVKGLELFYITDVTFLGGSMLLAYLQVCIFQIFLF